MKPRVAFERGRNGRGVHVTMRDGRGRFDSEFGLSYMEAAEALFDLKDFLRESYTGRSCVDNVHKRRMKDESA